MLPCDFTLSTGVANMSSLAQLRVRDTKKQKQRRHDDARLTESRNARNEQLTDQELLPGKHLNGFRMFKGPANSLDMKYQTCGLLQVKV